MQRNVPNRLTRLTHFAEEAKGEFFEDIPGGSETILVVEDEEMLR